MRNSINRRERPGYLNKGHRQKGAVLVTGLLVTTVVTMVAVNAAKSTVAQERMANNYRFSIESMNNAENGSLRALTLINDQELILNGFDDELDPNGDGNFDDRYSLVVADQANNVFFNVVVVDDDDGDNNPSVDSNGIVMLMAQGSSNFGSTSTTEVRIADTDGAVGPPILLDKAILTQDDLTIAGNPEQFGSNQDIHSNADIEISGSPTTGGTISAVGTVNVSGSTNGNNTIESDSDHVQIPDINPAAFAEYAELTFKSDGKIYDSNGGFVADASLRVWQGWEFLGGSWTTQGNNVAGGMLYFTGIHGNVRVVSAPGTNANPWEVSILADGWIDIAGSPTIANYMNPTHPPEVQSIQFLSGADIKILGNANQTFTGIIAAREQIHLNGNATIEGAVIAADKSNDSNLVNENTLLGNMRLIYDGDLTFSPGDPALGDGIAIVLSWRDREIARNADVFAP